MFKSGSIESELMRSMEKQLVANNIESKYKFSKMAKVLDYLNAAAHIFEKAGLSSEAIEITDVLKKIAEDAGWKDEISGGLADKKSPKDFDPKALAKGIKVEMEHTNDKHIATEIAMDHLTEDPKYYDKLETIEKDHK
jgi:hypothetical protein